jgi:hypothetical protein
MVFFIFYFFRNTLKPVSISVSALSVRSTLATTAFTKNRITDGRCSGSTVVITDVEPDLTEGRRLHDSSDHDGEQESAGGRRSDVGAAQDLADNGLTGNSTTTVPGRPPARRPRIPAVSKLHWRAAELVYKTKVSLPGDLVKGDGTEDEDSGWKSVGDRGDLIVPDPAIDLRPLGVKSKFWALMDDDGSDEEVIQSPYTPDLVRQAAVHGFVKDQLVEVEMALQDSSIQRQVEASVSLASSDTKVVLVRNIIKAWTE